MNKTLVKTVLITLVAIAVINRTGEGKALLSGDNKFLGIF
jgi:hypothetical protein